MNTFDQILILLKTRGPQTAQALAEVLHLTSMAAGRPPAGGGGGRGGGWG